MRESVATGSGGARDVPGVSLVRGRHLRVGSVGAWSGIRNAGGIVDWCGGGHALPKGRGGGDGPSGRCSDRCFRQADFGVLWRSLTLSLGPPPPPRPFVYFARARS